jgi:uncharacterized membrane protein YphA (DoxX/SURF4 family)
MTESGVGAALAIASRLVLGAVFLFSASRKKYTGTEFVAAMKAFGLPAPRLSAALLALVEIVLALSLLAWRDEPWPSVAAIVVLGAFTVAVAANLRRGLAVPCPCFGASERPVSGSTMVRNGWLAALAVLGTGSSGGAEGGQIAWLGAVLGGITAVVIMRTR